MSQLFTSGGQSIGASALASVLPKDIQGWFPLALTVKVSCLKKKKKKKVSFETESSKTFIYTS